MTTMNAASPSAGSLQEPGLSALAKLSYVLMLVGAVTPAASGIGTYLFGHPPMTQWILMVHVGASPVFSIGLTLVALTWTGRISGQAAATRCLFWLMMLCGLVLLISGAIPMTPVFGTDGQQALYLIHRYSGVTMTILILLHLLSLAFRHRSMESVKPAE